MVSYMREMSPDRSLPKLMRAKKLIKAPRRVAVVITAVACTCILVRASELHQTHLVPPVEKNATALWHSWGDVLPSLCYDEESDIFGLASRFSSYLLSLFRTPEPPKEPKKPWWHLKKKREGSPAVDGLRMSSQLFRKAAIRKTKHWGVETSDFLRGVEALMPTFEAFGMAIHAAAIKDVQGNVRKLKKNGAGRFFQVADLVTKDFLETNSTHPDSTAQAFLWLTRILKFTTRCFDELMRYPRKSLNACLTSAYEAELGPFHNPFMRSVAVALMQIIPDRQHMLSCFGLDSLQELTPHLKRWNDAVKLILDRSDRLYKAQRDVYYRTIATIVHNGGTLPPHRKIFLDDNDLLVRSQRDHPHLLPPPPPPLETTASDELQFPLLPGFGWRWIHLTPGPSASQLRPPPPESSSCDDDACPSPPPPDSSDPISHGR